MVINVLLLNFIKHDKIVDVKVLSKKDGYTGKFRGYSLGNTE